MLKFIKQLFSRKKNNPDENTSPNIYTPKSDGKYVVLYFERICADSLKNNPTHQQIIMTYSKGFNNIQDLYQKILYLAWSNIQTQIPANCIIFMHPGSIEECFNVKMYENMDDCIKEHFVQLVSKENT